MIDNVTDESLDIYRKVYQSDAITKQDIFWYVYGMLHHPRYRSKYEEFLIRDLPRIPFAPNFRAFVKAGMELAHLHLNWEACRRYRLKDQLSDIPDFPYRMDFGERGKDPTKFLVDNTLVFDNLPKVNYTVNGRTPHGWLTYKTKKHPYIDRYPFRHMTGDQIRAMLEKLIRVGLESDRIIESLTEEEFEMDVDVIQFNIRHKNKGNQTVFG